MNAATEPVGSRREIIANRQTIGTTGTYHVRSGAEIGELSNPLPSAAHTRRGARLAGVVPIIVTAQHSAAFGQIQAPTGVLGRKPGQRRAPSGVDTKDAAFTGGANHGEAGWTGFDAIACRGALRGGVRKFEAAAGRFDSADHRKFLRR